MIELVVGLWVAASIIGASATVIWWIGAACQCLRLERPDPNACEPKPPRLLASILEGPPVVETGRSEVPRRPFLKPAPPPAPPPNRLTR